MNLVFHDANHDFLYLAHFLEKKKLSCVMKQVLSTVMSMRVAWVVDVLVRFMVLRSNNPGSAKHASQHPEPDQHKLDFQMLKFVVHLLCRTKMPAAGDRPKCFCIGGFLSAISTLSWIQPESVSQSVHKNTFWGH